MPRKVNKTTPKPSMLATQRTKVKATKLEAGPATIKGGQAPGAGRKPPSTRSGQGSGRGSAPGMVNRNKPTMRKLAAKAAQSRKASTGRPLVRKEEMRKLMQKADRIKAGANAQRTIGDSGQVRAAQARGKAEVAKAQARRGAKAASKRMEGVLKAAGAARAVVGGLKTLGRGGVAAAVMAPRPAGDATLSAAMKRGDYKPKQGPKPATTQASFNKKTFDQAFKAARISGAKQFTWRGKKYTTKMKGE